MFFVFLALSMLQSAPSAAPDAMLSTLLDCARKREQACATSAMQERPKVETALKSLLGYLDTSIHSHREKPEQRKVQFSEPTLEDGLWLANAFMQVSGDDTFVRRFKVRRDRIEATRLLNQKEYRPALDLIHSVRKIAELLEDLSFVFSTYLTSAYGNLGVGDGPRALEDCRIALELARRLEDPTKEALALYNLGTGYMHLGKVNEALDYSLQATEAAHNVRNLIWEANAWLNVGGAQLLNGNLEKAESAFLRALEVATQAPDKLAEGRAVYNLGLVYHRMDRWEDASRFLNRSLDFIRNLDIRHSHEIEASGFNYVEKDALELLLRCYQKLNRTEPELINPIVSRLEELRSSASTAPHHHAH
ncbi:MAG: tetratricopeptide repeat protein [Acidobacteria bacterium]|nr:tetratricopeptide repeat protein [Acidobacteriota bacterium]